RFSRDWSSDVCSSDLSWVPATRQFGLSSSRGSLASPHTVSLNGFRAQRRNCRVEFRSTKTDSRQGRVRATQSTRVFVVVARFVLATLSLQAQALQPAVFR